MDTELKRQPSPLVNIYPFKFKHFPLLLEMHKNQQYMGINELKFKNLPKIGYICMLGKEPVAAGFLRKVEGGYAQLDTFCTNPYFGNTIRHDAINLITDTLINDAKQLKLTGLLAFSHDKSILDRAIKLGFNVCPDIIVGLKLS